MDVLGVRKIAEFHEDGGKLRRFQDDEACGAFWVVVELRGAPQIVDKAPREDVGVGPGLPALEIEQNVGDVRIVQPAAAAGASVCRILAGRDPRGLRIGSAIRHGIDGRAADVRVLAQRVSVDGDE